MAVSVRAGVRARACPVSVQKGRSACEAKVMQGQYWGGDGAEEEEEEEERGGEEVGRQEKGGTKRSKLPGGVEGG